MYSGYTNIPHSAPIDTEPLGDEYSPFIFDYLKECLAHGAHLISVYYMNGQEDIPLENRNSFSSLT